MYYDKIKTSQCKIWKISGLPIIDIKSLFDFDSESASDYIRHTYLIKIIHNIMVGDVVTLHIPYL